MGKSSKTPPAPPPKPPTKIVATERTDTGAIKKMHSNDGRTFTEKQMINAIERGEKFVTSVPGVKGAPIQIVESKDKEFVKTVPDGIPGNNLDNLPIKE